MQKGFEQRDFTGASMFARNVAKENDNYSDRGSIVGTPSRHRPSARERRKSVAKKDTKRESVRAGLAEETRLDMFFSDDGMEQLAVYCR